LDKLSLQTYWGEATQLGKAKLATTSTKTSQCFNFHRRILWSLSVLKWQTLW